jgi:hypothetical protein
MNTSQKSVSSALSAIKVRYPIKPGTPVVTGCPLPADQVPDGLQAAVIRFDGDVTTTAQVKMLTPATAGGVRWVELSFLAPRDGLATVNLLPAGVAAGSIPLASADSLLLDNGQIRVDLNLDPASPPIRVAWKGGSGTLAPELTVNGCRLREAPGVQRRIRMTRNGPLRCRVELEGQCVDGAGSPSLCYRLSVELWQGLSALRVDFMPAHEITGVPEVEVSQAMLAGDWSLGAGMTERIFLQPSHGGEGQPRIVCNPDPVTILSDDTIYAAHVRDFAMLRDEADYPFYCLPGAINVHPWLQLRGADGAVCVTLKDFLQSRPNAFDSIGNRLDYQMIPEGSTLTWPQGRRREQNLLIAFAAADEARAPAALAAQAETAYALGRAAPTPETLTALRCFELDRVLPYGTGGENVRMNRLLDRFCHLVMPAGKWDLGDTPNWHYTLGYAGAQPDYLASPENGGVPPKRFCATGGLLFPHAVAGLVEPTWTNNEYDMIHVLAIEAMRTGKTATTQNDGPALFDLLRWSVRHNIEVDFLTYSDDARHHRGSPFHARFHNSKGCITSHIWTQGLLEYYCLTGDDDARDTALALGEKIIAINHTGVTADWHFDREIGWALLALVCLVEMGYDRFCGEADAIAGFLRNYDRAHFDQRVKLSGGTEGRTLARQMIDCGFGYVSMVEALDKHQRVGGDPQYARWLEELLLELKAESWNKVDDGEVPTVHNMIGQIMAIGYERLNDPDFLAVGEVSLEHYLDPAFPEKHPLGGENGEGKPSAMSHRALCRFCGAMARAGRLQRFEYPAILARRGAAH